MPYIKNPSNTGTEKNDKWALVSYKFKSATYCLIAFKPFITKQKSWIFTEKGNMYFHSVTCGALKLIDEKIYTT